MRSRQIFAVLLLCVIVAIPANFAFAAKPFPLSVKVFWSSAYDDNILKYSPRDLDRFKTNTEIYPSEITTADDWVNIFGLRIYRDFKFSKTIRFRPYYSGRFSLYSINPVNNYQSHYFLARFSYRYRLYLYLQYSYMPGYYLRIYKDRDLNEYHSCNFDWYKPSAQIRWQIKPFQIESQFGLEWTYYNSHFTEYDSEAIFIGLSSTYQTPYDLDVTAGYLYKNSDNIGFNQASSLGSGISEEDAEYGDSSYEEDQYNLIFNYCLPLPSEWNWNFRLEIERRVRYYQSSLTVTQDPFHAGRSDTRDQIKPKISFSPSHSIEMEFEFTYDQRRTESPELVVPSIKNFVHRTFELTIIYQVF